MRRAKGNRFAKFMLSFFETVQQSQSAAAAEQQLKLRRAQRPRALERAPCLFGAVHLNQERTQVLMRQSVVRRQIQSPAIGHLGFEQAVLMGQNECQQRPHFRVPIILGKQTPRLAFSLPVPSKFGQRERQIVPCLACSRRRSQRCPVFGFRFGQPSGAPQKIGKIDLECMIERLALDALPKQVLRFPGLPQPRARQAQQVLGRGVVR